MSKKKNKDFQKVKLKVGRCISKGHNVTNTKFKAKKIVLLEQLKQHSDSPSIQPKVDIEDLLKKLDCPRSRQLSLRKIKMILNTDENALSTNVYRVLSQVCKSVLDIKSSIRSEALSVIRTIFCSIAGVQINSLFSVLQCYISCAATHMDRHVRYDSLKLIDLVLNFYPQAICSSCSILRNLLDLISSSSSKSKMSMKRQLTSTLLDDITAQEWRVLVLQHLVKFFHSSIHLIKAEKTDEDESEFNSNKLQFDSENQAIAIYRHFEFRPEESMTFSIKRSAVLQMDLCNTDAQFVKEFLLELMPLLFDTWQEAVPLTKLGRSFGDIVTDESIQIMMTVLHLICNILEWLSLLTKESLSHQYFEEFKLVYSHFVQAIMMPKFPFSFPICHRTQQEWKMGKTLEITSFTINITLCKVFALMVLDSVNCILSYHEKVKDLMLKEIEKSDGEDLDNLIVLLDTLALFVRDKSNYEDYEVHFKCLFALYQQCEDVDIINCIRNFFLNLVLTSTFPALYGSSTLQLWLAYLPEEFCNSVSNCTVNDTFLQAMKKVANFGYSSFIQSLTENAENIIELFKSSDQSVREVLVTLIPKIHKFTNNLFYKLAFVINNSLLSLQSIKHIFLAFNYRVSTKRNDGFLYEDYLSFLFNVVIGISPGDEIELIQKEKDLFETLQQTIPVTLSMYTVIPVTNWSKHMAVADIVISCLSRLPDNDNISICMQAFLQMFLSNISHVPVHTAACILNLYDNFSQEYIDANVKVLMGNLVVAYCFYEVALNNLPNSNEVRAIYSVGGQFVKISTNITEILEIYNNNKSNLSTVEILRFAGNILRQLVDASKLSHADINCLSNFLHHVKKVFGGDILHDIWFKGLVVNLTSQANS